MPSKVEDGGGGDGGVGLTGAPVLAWVRDSLDCPTWWRRVPLDGK